MKAIKTLQDFPDDFWKGRRVFIRVDFNVPIRNGKVADDTRIRAAYPTLQYLLERNSALILTSHLGRPKGTVRPEYSLAPAAQYLQRMFPDRTVTFVPEVVGPTVEKSVHKLQPGEILVLENLRFHPGEKANDEAFAQNLAKLAEAYVNDAFGTAHRAHASVVGVPRFVADRAIGKLMEKELRWLQLLRENPSRPYVVVLGGAKVSDKIPLIKELLKRADRILVGGGMAYTFLKAKQEAIGVSLVDEDHLDIVRQWLQEAPDRILLPEDHVVVTSMDENQTGEIVTHIPPYHIGVDVGPKTRERFQTVLEKAHTVFWNGPLGVFEKPFGVEGTRHLISVLKRIHQRGGVVVVGGGDTAAAARTLGVHEGDVSHISTGGGATLAYLAGEKLPALEALQA